ncbi:MAG: M28 family metallopeptidase [Gammaproteobacteria bacterium]
MKKLILISGLLICMNGLSKEIIESNIHRHVDVLASDEFEGRAPGTEGGEKTKKYLKNEFKKLGLSPIQNNFYLEVPLSKMTVNLNESFLSIANSKRANSQTLNAGSEVVYWTKRVNEAVSIRSSELVFVGYGIVAPEFGWNDYKNIDVTGKTVVMLINDPGFATEDANLFNGRAMTYYGRWTYKYEEAARQGADAVLIIHETAPAAYPWQVVETSWAGKQIDLKREDMGQSRVKVEGWITSEVAEDIFNQANLNLEQLKQDALSAEFQAVEMPGLTLDATLKNTIEYSMSHNVAAVKRGTKHPDEYILMMAHWDHLGMNDDQSGDNIYNGAVDNATGTAGLLELANYFSSIESERSLLFLAVTAEESGLLGSQYFAEYPPIDLSNVVAGYNFDAVLPMGKTKDMIVVGYGASQLEDILKKELNKIDKYITPDPEPEKGFFYRSDHISLAKKGVPMLYADGGIDKVDGGRAAGKAIADKYTTIDYHQPSDEYDSTWDLSGFTEQLTITVNMVNYLANSNVWPEWYEGNEFKSIREESKK